MKFTKRAVAKRNENGGSYLKLGDGESANGVFMGEVFEFWQSWPKGGDKQVFDKPTPGASSRFKVNFVIHDGAKFVARTWEFPVSVYNQLADISDAYDLATTKVRITRRGLEKSTTYMILPLNEKIPVKTLKEIEAVELNILGNQDPAAPAPIRNYAPGSDDDSEGLPF